MEVLNYQRPPTPTPGRVWLARAVAVAADAVQVAAFPVTAEGTFTPFPVADVIDVVTAVVLTLLVGPHLAFVPSFLVKVLPIVDLAPTWTIAVLIATGGRQRQQPADPGPLAPVPALPAGDPGGRRSARAAYTRTVAWFAVLFAIGFVVGGAYLMPHLPHAATTLPGHIDWTQNWPGAVLGGVLGLFAARTVLRRAGQR